MKLNSKVTSGLAWAGLAVVLGVPAADLVTKSTESQAGVSVNRASIGTDAMETSSITPKAPIPAVRQGARVTAAAGPAVDPVAPAAADRKTQVAATTDVVDEYLAKGKKLPSYISDGSTAAAAPQEPAVVKPIVEPKAAAAGTAATTLPVTPDGTFADAFETRTAALAPTTAPKPYPASMRPRTTSVVPAGTVAATTPAPTTSGTPLIIDESELSKREAALRATEPLLEDFEEETAPVITDDELQEWDSGSLADYLDRKGLIDESAAESDLEEDGFFIEETPNRSKVRVVRRVRDADFFLF